MGKGGKFVISHGRKKKKSKRKWNCQATNVPKMLMGNAGGKGNGEGGTNQKKWRSPRGETDCWKKKRGEKGEKLQMGKPKGKKGGGKKSGVGESGEWVGEMDGTDSP